MPYVGNTPALNYTSFAVQHFTTSATTGYTLDHAVTNENDIRLVINNVVQQPGGSYAYTAAGTVLTLSVATAGTDTMYCVFLGKAVQTVNPGAASVGTSQLADESVNEAKLKVSNSPTNGQVLSAQSGAAGGLTWAADAGGAALTGSTNNTVVTVTGANAIQGETNLQFDGTNLGIGKSPSRTLDMEDNGDYFINLNDGTDASVGSTNRGVNLYAGGSIPLKLRTNEVEVTSKLGIGEDAPQQKLHIGEASSDGVYQVFTNDTTGHTASNGFLLGIDGSEDALIWQYENNDIYFGTNGSERMRIDNDGRLFVNSTTVQQAALVNVAHGGNSVAGISFNDTDSASNATYASFIKGGTLIGNIRRNGSADEVNYNTSSDYRLKDGIVDKTDGIEKIKLLKPRKFYWKSDSDKTLVDGFIAHEVSDVVPQAISGVKDAMTPEVLYDEEVLYTADDELPEGKNIGDVKHSIGDIKEATKINPQGIDQSKIVPLLVASVQELITENETLKTRITALENA